MAKEKTTFLCSECGNTSPRWLGQCPSCKSWNTIAEYKEPKNKKGTYRQGYAGDSDSKTYKLREVSSQEEFRVLSGIGELDRVFGGGITRDSVNLISADPGAGKTTLLSQAIGKLTKIGGALYATSEESLSQFKNRFEDRLQVEHEPDDFHLMSDTNVDNIIMRAEELNVQFLVVDSIQSVFSDDFTGSQGSVSQVKGCAQKLSRLAKTKGVTVFLIGHVNKSNDVAGPKTLTHVVDAIFHIDVSDGDLRIIRPSKNRFGDIDTVGLFRMMQQGMVSIDNPSKIFLSSLIEPTSGTAITCYREGNRNLLLELQSLVTESDSDYTERVCIGLNFNRLKMISAILRKHVRLNLHQDVYVSLVGGLKLPDTDSSADLALAASLYSSVKDVIIDKQTCFIGELSLSGEIRPVSGGVPRVKEAIRHGFKRIFIPQANFNKSMNEDKPNDVTIIQLKTIQEMIGHFK